MAGGINCNVILGLSFRVSKGLVRKKREREEKDATEEAIDWKQAVACVCVYVCERERTEREEE